MPTTITIVQCQCRRGCRQHGQTARVRCCSYNSKAALVLAGAGAGSDDSDTSSHSPETHRGRRDGRLCPLAAAAAAEVKPSSLPKVARRRKKRPVRSHPCDYSMFWLALDFALSISTAAIHLNHAQPCPASAQTCLGKAGQSAPTKSAMNPPKCPNARRLRSWRRASKFSFTPSAAVPFHRVLYWHTYCDIVLIGSSE